MRYFNCQSTNVRLQYFTNSSYVVEFEQVVREFVAVTLTLTGKELL